MPPDPVGERSLVAPLVVTAAYHTFSAIIMASGIARGRVRTTATATTTTESCNMAQAALLFPKEFSYLTN